MRVALVTGAGRGVGAGIAVGLADAGYAVAVNDLTADAAAETVHRIREKGRVAAGFAADVTDPESVADMVGQIRSDWGPVLVSVANASGPQPEIPLPDLQWLDVAAHLDFFVKSPLLLARAVLPDMQAAGFGRIVHIGSDLFERGSSGWSGYMAGKGALLGLTRGWAQELGPSGITVNLVAPGWIPVERHAQVPEPVLSAYAGERPVARVGVPADVASAVVFLASEGAGFVTGQRIGVNGGHHLG
jgi:NAD(P)-dependent dehydrogenase (short-subunit alcohol dehydrogenase family)